MCQAETYRHRFVGELPIESEACALQLDASMLRRVFSLLVPFVSLLVLPSCGGRSVEATGGEGGETGAGHGAASGGAAEGGGAHGGNNSGGTGVGGFSGGTGAAGSGGSSSCEAYFDQPGTTVGVELVNHTQEAIYLGSTSPGCGGPAQIQVADASGPLSAPGLCRATCQNLIQGTTALCVPIACPVNAVLTLQPGESTSEEWGGAFLRDASLPLACRPASGASDCQRVEGVAPGVYTFSAIAGTTLDCSQLGGAPCQPCMPSAGGGCWTAAAVIAGPFLTAKTQVMLDSSYGVGGTGRGAVQAVQVIFGN